MPGLNSRTRELIAYGEACGFVFDGRDGHDHYRMVHPNGEVVRISGSPGDYRGDRNQRAEMRRKSGVTPQRPKSGSYRKGVRLTTFTPAEERVESKSWTVEGLTNKHRSLCGRIRDSQSPEDAAEFVRELLAVEAEFAALGVKPPPRSFRTHTEQ
jgi:hypothetical protein